MSSSSNGGTNMSGMLGRWGITLGTSWIGIDIGYAILERIGDIYPFSGWEEMLLQMTADTIDAIFSTNGTIAVKSTVLSISSIIGLEIFGEQKSSNYWCVTRPFMIISFTLEMVRSPKLN